MAAITSLPNLTPREGVIDAIHRCFTGMDTNDHELYESACLQDESMTVVIGPTTVQGWKAIREFSEKVFHIVTSHAITNIRVALEDGAETASVTASAMAFHLRPAEAFTPEDTSYTSASVYRFEVVKDSKDGLWKIKRWEFQVLWTVGDPTVMHGEEVPEFITTLESK